MKYILLITALVPFSLFGQKNDLCSTWTKINAVIQQNHYTPKPVDDSLSVYVFDSFLQKLDENNRIFLESEIVSLKNHRLKIDDYLTKENCTFIEDFYKSYSSAYERYKKVIIAIKNEPFPLSSKEKIHFIKKNAPHLKSENELKLYYKKRLLFNTLQDITELSENKDSILQHFTKISEKIKKEAFDNYECKIQNEKLAKSDFEEVFLSVFCSYFDPHTAYFSDAAKSAFLSHLEDNNFSFGMDLSLNEKNEIIVQQIIPGSTAYYSEKIDAGDQIIKISNQNNEYLISCTSIDKIEEILQSEKYTSADFTLKKQSGKVYNVSLFKKNLKNYENNLYSYVIEKNGAKTGYISIPSFYATFDNGTSNVSTDLTKEILKLQRDQVSGLILDLQNNGGGSMTEAVRIAGMFIDIGPVGQVNNKKTGTEIIKDLNRGMVYTGPLVVLINGFSASASEFLTNAIQDYNRGIVIGDTSFGKASMQQILPLENSDNQFIKLTQEAFYRVTGKSNQKNGITPDVQIPTLFRNQMPRESDNKTALQNTVLTNTVRYPKMENSSFPSIIEQSRKRVSENEFNNKTLQLNTQIDQLYDNDLPPILLNIENVFAEMSKMKTLWKEIKNHSEKEVDFNIQRNSTDIEYQQFDEYLKSSNTDKIKQLRSNPYILEALNIINDIRTQKN
ncbi:S41 family peptidase [Flavobacterium pedocola]